MLPADNLIGQSIGGYRISIELPSRGTEQGYLAESETGQQIIFTLISSQPLISAADQESFLQEASILQQLKHPHILPILDYGLTQGLPYRVTPYTSWRTLSTLIRRRWSSPFDLQETLRLLSQLGETLHYAHQRQIFHNQLTPQSVLIDSQNQLLLK